MKHDDDNSAGANFGQQPLGKECKACALFDQKFLSIAALKGLVHCFFVNFRHSEVAGTSSFIEAGM